MSEGRIEISKPHGDWYTLLVNISTSDGRCDTPLDLTGLTWLAYLRKVKAATGAPDAQFTVTVDPTAGTVQLDIDLGMLTVDTLYYWDLQFADVDGHKTTLFAGSTLTTFQDVTHS